jgi:membrane fusion protein (multidrug efflux system)
MAESEGESADKSESQERTSFGRRPLVIVLGTIFLIFAFFWAFDYLVDTFTHESTDDAFLDGHIISIAPKVPGQVTQVVVTNNQAVKAGQLLVEIDARDLVVVRDQKRAAVHSAEANVELLHASLALLQAQIETARATAKQSAAEVSAAEATAQRTAGDLKRAEELMRGRTISPQEYDNAKTAATSAQANLVAAQERAASDQSKIVQAQAQFEAGRQAYRRGQAQTQETELEQKTADLNLSYAQVTAPEEGFVTRKAVENGDYLQVGQRLMALVTTRLWVTANFKETQLRKIRVGQPVRVTIDSIDGKSYSARVQSIQAGSGARFSLLPPENAVGNYVKVVQRIPVRIEFDAPIQAEHVLGPGMSVSPSVRTSDVEISKLWLWLAAIILGLALGFLWMKLAGRKREESTGHKLAGTAA